MDKQNGAFSPVSWMKRLESSSLDPGFERRFPWLVLGAYLLMVLWGAHVHEPWFDEAQGWLLVRDSSLWELLSQRLRLEGHPPLWYLLLYPFVRLRLPYEGLNYLSVLVASIGVALLVFERRLPWPVRLVLPFTYFVGYQYAVVARSYVLFFPILVGLTRMWPEPWRRPRLFALLLSLLALVSSHGVCLVGVLFFVVLWEGWQTDRFQGVSREHLLEALLMMAGVLVLIIFVLVPVPPLSIQPKLDMAKLHFLENLPNTLVRIPIMLTDNIWTGLFMGGLIALWLASRRQFCLSLLLLGCLVPLLNYYSNLWHEGMFFIALLIPLLLAFMAKPVPRTPSWVQHCGVLALCIVSGFHIFWLLKTLQLDTMYSYSGSRAAAEYLKAKMKNEDRIVAMGFPSLGLQPYFRQNIYANYRGGKGGAYWDWGVPPPLYYAPSFLVQPDVMLQWTNQQLTMRPEWVVVSVKFPSERLYQDEIQVTGEYLRGRLFPGAHFWKYGASEIEAFVIYRKK